MGMNQKRSKMADSKQLIFLKLPILKIISQKIHGLVELIDVKGTLVSRALK